jgi:hypothetical protein
MYIDHYILHINLKVIKHNFNLHKLNPYHNKIILINYNNNLLVSINKIIQHILLFKIKVNNINNKDSLFNRIIINNNLNNNSNNMNNNNNNMNNNNNNKYLINNNSNNMEIIMWFLQINEYIND